MKLNKILLISAFTTMSLTTVAHAAPLVTFQGEVSAQTCVASINGETNSTVLLATVASKDLAAAGATAGLTPFTISISGCEAPQTSALNIKTMFLGHNVTSKGNLGNKATTNAATNVSIQLTADEAGTNPVVLNGATSVPGLVLPVAATKTNHSFGARYYAEADGVTAGAVTAVAEYTLSYF